MILTNKLFKIRSSQNIQDGILYHISLIPESEIYKAHFPNKPITPGVCVVQIVIELLNDYYLENYKLSSIKNLKFLQVINPNEYKDIKIELKKVNIDNNVITLQAIACNNEVQFTKMSLQCVKE